MAEGDIRKGSIRCSAGAQQQRTARGGRGLLKLEIDAESRKQAPQQLGSGKELGGVVGDGKPGMAMLADSVPRSQPIFPCPFSAARNVAYALRSLPSETEAQISTSREAADTTVSTGPADVMRGGAGGTPPFPAGSDPAEGCSPK